MKMRTIACLLFLAFSATTHASASGNTKHITPVSDFSVERYMGKWYEIARLPNWFEKGLNNVTATYTLLPDGKVDVKNEGYLENGRHKIANGKAKIIDPSVPARLSVSFFLWFGADYLVFELDKQDYNYAMVTSSSMDYLWILCRQPQMDSVLYDTLVEKARQLGYKTDALIKVEQKPRTKIKGELAING